MFTTCFHSLQKWLALTILTPLIETPDPPNDTPGASKQVVLTPHDIPRILRVEKKHPMLLHIPKSHSMGLVYWMDNFHGKCLGYWSESQISNNDGLWKTPMYKKLCRWKNNSGQIIIFHQPRISKPELRGFGGDCLTKSPFGVTNMDYNTSPT